MENNKQSQFTFDHPREERIYRRLTLIGEGPASFFKDACKLMVNPNELISTSHVVSHLLREIESSIRAVLETYMTEGEEEKGQKQKSMIKRILAGLGISESDPVAIAWFSLTGQGNEYALHKRAHRDALAKPRIVDEEFVSWWDTLLGVFDHILEAFEGRYLETHRILDHLQSKENPTKEDVDILQNKVPNNQVSFGYFFGRLDNEVWLGKLNEAGFFLHPPAPLIGSSEGTISYPIWPQSEYLSRMASVSPQKVVDIIIQNNIVRTENIYVHNGIFKCAIIMPVELSARLMETELEWISNQRSLFLSDDVLGDIIVQLLVGGYIDLALVLASTILMPIIDGQQSEPRTKLRDWEYGSFLDKITESLTKCASDKGILWLCSLLEYFLTKYFQKEVDQIFVSDHSTIWQSKIPYRRPYPEIKNILVSAIYNVAEGLISESKISIPKFIEILESKKYAIFHRVALCIIAKHSHEEQDLARQRMLNHKLIESFDVKKEYQELAAAFFGELNEEDQYFVLGRLEDKYKTRTKEWLESRTDTPVSDNEINTKLEEVLFYEIHTFYDSLPESWKVRLSRYKTNFQPEEDEDTVWSGPTSPLSDQELSSLSIEEIVKHLIMWKPSGEWRSPTPEGLGRQLSQLIQEKPEKYDSGAHHFKHSNIDPTYVRFFLYGFEVAVREKRVFDWDSILDLCDWVIEQIQVPKRTLNEFDQDPDWGFTRKAIASLLVAGLNKSECEIPFSYREKVWSLIYQLTLDPQPTPEYEQKYIKSNESPSNLSINTVRGQAIHATIYYSFWIERNVGLPVPIGLHIMPEVRAVLETHLVEDSSLAIRSIYGQYFPSLLRLDKSWASTYKPIIFPRQRSEVKYYKAAWDTYLLFCRPYDTAYEVLQEEYSFAVESINTENADEQEELVKSLAEHLMVFFWRGIIRLNCDLLEFFFESITDIVTAHAIEHIGRGLNDVRQPLDPSVIERLRSLWEYRNEIAGRHETGVHSKEMEAFAWWLKSNIFENIWSLEQFNKGLALCKKVDGFTLHLISPKLMEMSIQNPYDVVYCLSLIEEKDLNGWVLRSNREEVRNTLKVAIESSNEKARVTARALINKMGSKGNMTYADLLRDR